MKKALLYSKFPKEKTESEITEMFYDGRIACMCGKCNKEIEIDITDTFICPHCKAEQFSPHMNPFEVNHFRNNE